LTITTFVAVVVALAALYRDDRVHPAIVEKEQP
jgi:hypothetical protein